MPKIRKAYKVRLKTNREIESILARYCGSARFLWNKTLAMNLERLGKGYGMLWYNELAFWLRLWKQTGEYGFLKECPSQVLQQKLVDLERAFRDCFDKNQPLKRLPVFKKKGRSEGIRFPQGFKLEGRRIFLPKIGRHPSDSEIGIDAGIACFAAFSDGAMIEGVNSFRRHERICPRDHGRTGKQYQGQVGIEQVHTGSGLVCVQTPAWIQAFVAGRKPG